MRVLLLEQVAAVVPISVLLVVVMGAAFGVTVTDPLLIVFGLSMAILGLTLFIDALRVVVMPLSEQLGTELPKTLSLSGVLCVTCFLGVLVTYAEPAITSLRPLARLVDAEVAPYLYCALMEKQELLVFVIGLGVGLAAMMGSLALTLSQSLALSFCLAPVLSFSRPLPLSIIPVLIPFSRALFLFPHVCTHSCTCMCESTVHTLVQMHAHMRSRARAHTHTIGRTLRFVRGWSLKPMISSSMVFCLLCVPYSPELYAYASEHVCISTIYASVSENVCVCASFWLRDLTSACVCVCGGGLYPCVSMHVHIGTNGSGPVPAVCKLHVVGRP